MSPRIEGGKIQEICEGNVVKNKQVSVAKGKKEIKKRENENKKIKISKQITEIIKCIERKRIQR